MSDHLFSQISQLIVLFWAVGMCVLILVKAFVRPAK